jgi:hypothetical protein
MPPRSRQNFVGVILCACGEPAEMATFFFNGTDTEITCTKCHVIAVASVMAQIDAQIAAEQTQEVTAGTG